MSSKLLLKGSNLLANDLALFFGKECLCVAVWMLTVMFVKLLCHWTRLDRILPNGIIFASPFIMAFLKRYCPMFESSALLPVRFAEAVMGRINLLKLAIVVPAHFVGCIAGIVTFRVLLPFKVPSAILFPIVYTHASPTTAVLGEVLVVAMYTVANIILPNVLYVNKLPYLLISVVTLPIACITVGTGNKYSSSAGSTFHPVAQYALWYLSSPDSTQISPAAEVYTKIYQQLAESVVSTVSAAGGEEVVDAVMSAGDGALQHGMESAAAAATAAVEGIAASAAAGGDVAVSATTVVDEVVAAATAVGDIVSSLSDTLSNTNLSSTNVSEVSAALLQNVVNSAMAAAAAGEAGMADAATVERVVPMLGVQPLHIIGPLIGGLLAGYICLKLCPDDPLHWRAATSTNYVSAASFVTGSKRDRMTRNNKVVGNTITCK